MCNRSLCKTPTDFLQLWNLCHHNLHFCYFQRDASFNTFTDITFPWLGSVMFLNVLIKTFSWCTISFAKFGPIWVKYLLKLSAIDSVSVMLYFSYCLFKACVRYFCQIFIFHQTLALHKLWKMFFISSKKLFSFLRYSNFCIFVCRFFFPCQPFI